MAEEFAHDAVNTRYTVTVDGEPAGFAEYAETTDGVLDFHHTVIDPEFRGQGLSKPLIQAALDDTRAAGDKVRPLCSAVAGFIEKHPEYRDLVQS